MEAIRTEHLAARLSVSPIGLGCMSMSGVYGKADDAECDPLIHHALDAASTSSTPPTCTAGATTRAARQGAVKGRRDKVVLATKFGQTAAKPGGPTASTAARVREGGLRGEPEAARRRRDRPLLPAPRRSRGADRGHGGRDGRLVRAGQGARARAVARPARRPSAARTRCIRSPPCRASIRCSTASMPRRRCKTTRELGISFVAYSPLGRSLLTGAVRQVSDIPEGTAAAAIRASPPRTSRATWRGRSHRSRRARKGLQAGAGGARLAAGAGPRHRADPRHQAGGASTRTWRRSMSCCRPTSGADLGGAAARRGRGHALSRSGMKAVYV